MGKTKVEAPKPSPLENEVLQEQLNLMRRFIAREDALEPFVLNTLGIVKNPDGSYRSMTEEEYFAHLTPLEKSLYQLQQQQMQISSQALEMEKEALQKQKSLEPLIFESLGYVRRPDGSYRKMTEEEYYASLTGLEKTIYDTTKMMLERQQKALRGELPVSEGLKQTKEREWKLFKEAMARAGNPIYGETPEGATSPTTAGIQGIRQFQERFGILEEAERKGELTAGTSAALQMMGVTSDIGSGRSRSLSEAVWGPARLAASLSEVPSLANELASKRQTLYGYINSPLQQASVFSGLLAPFERQRMLEYQTSYANAMSRSGLMGGVLGAVGTLGGALLMSPKILSSRKFKKDIKKTTVKEEEQALKTLKNMKTYTYRYKHEDDKGSKRYGLLAENAPSEIVTPDGQGIDVGRMMGLLTSASRAIARQVEGRN